MTNALVTVCLLSPRSGGALPGEWWMMQGSAGVGKESSFREMLVLYI